MAEKNEKQIKGRVTALPELERMFKAGPKVSDNNDYSISIDGKEYVLSEFQFKGSSNDIKIGDWVEAKVVSDQRPNDRFQEASGHINSYIKKINWQIKANDKGWNSASSLPIAEAIEAGIQKQRCFVYKLSVGGSDYIGFTSQRPEIRLKQHLESSKDGSKLKVHIELRRFGYLHEFEVISEHKDEVSALVAEIINIKKFQPELNSSIGGEGNNYNVVEETDKNTNEKIFCVENLRRKKENVGSSVKVNNSVLIKMSHTYLKALITKIQIRYQKLEKSYEEKAVKWVYENYPVGHATVDNRWGDLTRLLVFKYTVELRQRHNKLVHWDYHDLDHIDIFNIFLKQKNLKCFRKGLVRNTLDRRVKANPRNQYFSTSIRASIISENTSISLEEARTKIEYENILKADDNFDHELMLFYQSSFPNVERVFVSEEHLGLSDLAMKIADNNEYGENILSNNEFISCLRSQDWLVRAIENQIITENDAFFFPKKPFKGSPKKTKSFFGTKLTPTEKHIWEGKINVRDLNI